MGCNIYQKEKVYILSALTVTVNNLSRARDPPGQRCTYIPPGNPFEESYRLSTFLKFPQEVPVNPRSLARAGFLYTGFKDRVKCFSCGLTVDEWVANDDVTSTRWHKDDCKIARGEDSGNIPLGEQNHYGVSKIKSSSYSRYYAKGWNDWWAYLRRNFAAVADRWGLCARFEWPGNRTPRPVCR